MSAVLKQALALTDADYGALFLPQVALAIAGAVAGGGLARKLGLKALLAMALAANAVSQVLLAASALASPSGGFALLFAGTGSLGLGFGLIGGPVNAYPGLLFPRRGQTAIVAAHTLIGLGLATGPLIAGPFAAAGAWSLFPALLAVACIIAAIGSLLIHLPQPAAILAGADSAGARPAASLGFWLFAAITVIYAFAEGTFSSWAVIFLRDVKGLPGMTASYALSAFWGALVAGRLLVSVLIVRVPVRLVWIALPVLMIAAFWLVSLTNSAATGIGAFALAGVACSAFLPLTISLAADRFPGSVAWVSSMLIAALMTGVGVGFLDGRGAAGNPTSRCALAVVLALSDPGAGFGVAHDPIVAPCRTQTASFWDCLTWLLWVARIFAIRRIAGKMNLVHARWETGRQH